jgi:hypothetical protein
VVLHEPVPGAVIPPPEERITSLEEQMALLAQTIIEMQLE